MDWRRSSGNSRARTRKQVGKQPASCPLWLEGKNAELRESPDELKRLKAAAVAMHREGNLVGADLLLRRAVALGDEEKETLELLRTVEFILEDAPFKLP